MHLIRSKEGDLCVTFYQRPDGTVITRDCVSVLGTKSLREKYNILAVLNAAFSAFALSIMPMLGPAVCTIVNGVGPAISSNSEADRIERYKTLVADEKALPTVRLGLSNNADKNDQAK